MRVLAVSALTPGTAPEALAADMAAEIAHGRMLWAAGDRAVRRGGRRPAAGVVAAVTGQRVAAARV